MLITHWAAAHIEHYLMPCRLVLVKSYQWNVKLFVRMFAICGKVPHQTSLLYLFIKEWVHIFTCRFLLQLCGIK